MILTCQVTYKNGEVSSLQIPIDELREFYRNAEIKSITFADLWAAQGE